MSTITLDLTKAGNEEDQPLEWVEEAQPDGTVRIVVNGRGFLVRPTEERTIESLRDNVRHIIRFEAMTPEEQVAYYKARSAETRHERMSIVHKGRTYDPTDAFWNVWEDLSELTQALVLEHGTFLHPDGTPMTAQEREEALEEIPVESAASEHRPKPKRGTADPDRTPEAVQALVLYRIRERVTASGEGPSTRAIREKVSGRAQDVDDALRALIEDGRVEKRPGKRNNGFAFWPTNRPSES